MGFNWNILNSIINSFNCFLNHNGLFNCSFDIFNLSLDGIVVSDGSFDGNSLISYDFLVFGHLYFNWNLIDLFDLFIFNVFLFEWDVLDSALDWDFLSNSSLLNCMRSRDCISSNCTSSVSSGISSNYTSSVSSNCCGSSLSANCSSRVSTNYLRASCSISTNYLRAR